MRVYVSVFGSSEFIIFENATLRCFFSRFFFLKEGERVKREVLNTQ